MTLRLFLKLLHYHCSIAFVVAGLISTVCWGINGEFPDGTPLKLTFVILVLLWLRLYSPHFKPHEQHYVRMFSPVKLVFLFVMAQIVKPENIQGYMLTLALYSLLTTHDIVRGRVFN